MDAARQSGWFELRTPDETAGPLASGVEVAIVARELGRVAADTPFFGPVVAADLARLAGNELDADGASVVLHPSLHDFAVLPPDAVESVAAEGVAVDCATAERGLMLAVGDRGGDATRVIEVALGVPAPATDLTRALASVTTGAVSTNAPDGPVVADAALERCRALALAITVADLVGTMEGALDITSAYAQERQQYGVAIGSFQAVQHLLAEARVLVEGAISVAQYAAWAVDALPPDDAFEAGGVAKGVLRAPERWVCRDNDPGARRHRQHLGVLRARVPAPRAALERAPRRRGVSPACAGTPSIGIQP